MANQKSKEPPKINSLDTLHPYGKRLASELVSKLKEMGYDARILETSRTPERQQYLYNKKASKTLKSNHLGGMAFDVGLFDEKGKYIQDSSPYQVIGKALQDLGARNNTTWGGDWGWDYGHIEYPQIKKIKVSQ